MKCNTRRAARVASVLAALAFGILVVQNAAADGGSVGLARGILETQFGFSPARAAAWTTGACSYPDRPASCYQTPSQSRTTSVAEARALGVFQGMTAQQAYDWSVGVCSYADKPSSCYLTPAEAVAQSKALAKAMGVPSLTSIGSSGSSKSDFGWRAAGIGGAAVLGVVLVVVGVGFTLARRRVRPLPYA